MSMSVIAIEGTPCGLCLRAATIESICLETFNLNRILIMKSGRAKNCSKHKYEVDVWVTFKRDPNKFVGAEAEASAVNKLACDAKQSAKKKIVKNQDYTTPVNIENMMKK